MPHNRPRRNLIHAILQVFLENEIFNKALNAYADGTKKSAKFFSFSICKETKSAEESGRSYQLCLQLFCQEEFLRRLEKSKYAENLVLKGSLFIYSVTDFDNCVTMNVDSFLRKHLKQPPETGRWRH